MNKAKVGGIVAIVAVVAVLIGTVVLVVWSISAVATRVQEQGLKNILEQVWEGESE